MQREPLEMIAIQSIIKFELAQAPKRFLAAATGKNRMERDDALSALAERIANRFKNYEIMAVRHDNPFAHLAVPPKRSPPE